MTERAASERQMAGRQGGYLSWSRTVDRTARTQRGRDRFMQRFEQEVLAELGDVQVAPAQLRKMAEARRRAYFVQLQRKSAAARRARAGTKR